MAIRRTEVWMWAEACEMLARAERLHRTFFELQRSRRAAAWEPPVDVFETPEQVFILAALPGIDPDRVELSIDGDELVIAGTRALPAELHNAVIHRLELPQGRFERRLMLPSGRYGAITRAAMDGCLVIRLTKARG